MARQQPTDVHIQFYVLPSASSSDGKGEAAPATAFACAFWPVLRSLWFGGGAAASSSSSSALQNFREEGKDQRIKCEELRPRIKGCAAFHQNAHSSRDGVPTLSFEPTKSR